MKLAFLCLAHALIIAIASVNGDPKYKSYRDGFGLKQPVQDLLSASNIKLKNGESFKELELFQNYISDYKIIFHNGLRPDRVFSVEIPFRTKNCSFYMMMDTSMWLQTSKLLW